MKKIFVVVANGRVVENKGFATEEEANAFAEVINWGFAMAGSYGNAIVEEVQMDF